MRSKLSNFGLVITILIMIFFDYSVGLDTPKLNVPNKFEVFFNLWLFKFILMLFKN